MGLFDSIGDGVNSIGRFFGNDDRQRQDIIDQGFEGAQRRSADIDTLVAQLQGQAAGTGPSLAQQQLQRAGQQSLNQQQALMASARPGQGALAQRMAAQNSSRIGSDLAQQAAALRLREQMQAREQLRQLLLAARGQDLGQLFGGRAEQTFSQRLFDTGGEVAAKVMSAGAGGGA